MLERAAPRPANVRQTALPRFGPEVLRPLTVALLAAALAETALLRLVTRVGVHLPKDAAVGDAFAAASSLGSFAFNFASLLAIILAVPVLSALVTAVRSPGARAVLAGVAAATMAGLALSLATGAAAADAAFGAGAALLVALAVLLPRREGALAPAAGLAVALIAAAYLSYQYYALSYLSYRIADIAAVPPMSISVLRLGEALALAAAPAAFWAWGLPRRDRVGALGVGAVAVVLLGLALAGLSPASTMSILALWTSGLSLFLPFPLYLVALGLYLLTLIACWRDRNAFWTAAGLLLVLLSGYMPEATYQHLLLLLGVALLSGVLPPARRPASGILSA